MKKRKPTVWDIEEVDYKESGSGSATKSNDIGKMLIMAPWVGIGILVLACMGYNKMTDSNLRPGLAPAVISTLWNSQNYR